MSWTDSTESGHEITRGPGAWVFRAGLFVATMMAVTGLAQAPGPAQLPEGYHPEKDTSVTAVNQRPDPNRLMEINAGHVRTARFAAANAERKRQMSADAGRLLQLATELNTGLEGNAEGDAALAARLDTIEKLAHAVKEKMKLTMASP